MAQANKKPAAGATVREAFSEPNRPRKPRPGLPPPAVTAATDVTDSEAAEWDALTRMLYDTLDNMRGQRGAAVPPGEREVIYSLPKDLPVGRPVARVAKKYLPIIEASPELALVLLLGPHTLTAFLAEFENIRYRAAVRAAAARNERRSPREERLREDHASEAVAVPT